MPRLRSAASKASTPDLLRGTKKPTLAVIDAQQGGGISFAV
jgi:hypothetical protein